MNRDRIEKWILLAESGELSPRRLRRLEALLAADPELARLRRGWSRMSEAARSPEADRPLAAFGRSRILREAEAQGAEPAARPGIPLWKPAWALAACLLVLFLAGRWFNSRPGGPGGSPVAASGLWAEWEQGFENRLDGFDQSLSELVQLWEPPAGSGAGEGADDELNELGRQLLELES